MNRVIRTPRMPSSPPVEPSAAAPFPGPSAAGPSASPSAVPAVQRTARPAARPLPLADALRRLAEPGTDILAGGTDWYAALGERAAPRRVVDITRIPELAGIEPSPGGGWRIGAGASWSALLARPLPSAFDALRAAAREVGSVQIQNTATLVGNLCNASPAADGVPPLLALDASVELVSPGGTRTLALGDFLLGPRRTARRADELVTAILVPPHADGTVARFAKLGGRRYLVISIAMVAAVLEPDPAGRVARARVVVGACSAVATRLPALEAALLGRAIDDPALGEAVGEEALAPLAPIDDIRASGAYRLEAVRELLARLLAPDPAARPPTVLGGAA